MSGEKEQAFSSLFPAHLYLKGRTTGHEIEHNEELHDQEITVPQDVTLL